MTHPSANRPVQDFLIPICNLHLDEEGQAIPDESELVGTSFLIGDLGFALTAAHVIDQTSEALRYGLVAVDNLGKSFFHALKVIDVEKHPTEDVAIIKFDPFPDGKRISFFNVNDQKYFQSTDYHMWSYPLSVAEEIKLHGLPEKILNFRPDITFFKGYVRRRMSFSPNPSFDQYKGSLFFEVSEIGGACASGSPLVDVKNGKWNAFAIYVGEETANRKCGYALALEQIADWKPNILDKTIKEEAMESASARI